jgi:uncharacterized Fe-S center protein
MNKSKVLMTKDISPKGLVNIYKALGVELKGKVAVKIHIGEPGGHNYLKPDLVKDLVLLLNGTFVDCNTAYGGGRAKTENHLQAAKDHGFTEYTNIDIMDADGELELPIKNGMHLKSNFVGSHLANYDSVLMLSHFKGHAMGGFGGAMKNMSIGVASARGKALIHSAGASETNIFGTEQDAFLESMAEAAKTVADYEGKNIIYINVMNNISIDCDCDNNPAKPEIGDIGILASTDPVAIDKACLDLIYSSNDSGKASLIERIESKNGAYTIECAEKIGMGTQDYELVSID